MAKENFQYITDEYVSNCFFEAIKAKIKNPKVVKVYFCKPRITENGNFQWMHFMWTNGKSDYDFSDDENRPLAWYQRFWFSGRIRRFKKGFAKRYSEYRNKRR